MGTRDPRIDTYIAKQKDFAKLILTHLRDVVHEGKVVSAHDLDVY